MEFNLWSDETFMTIIAIYSIVVALIILFVH